MAILAIFDLSEDVKEKKWRNKQTVVDHPKYDTDLGITAFTFIGVTGVCRQQYRITTKLSQVE